ncbi:hypothetical protein LAT59_00275 [Candidatus Gracilibacteria bacterium]|nr:hypothetical protein [Candidatus Gracilibacteria bacterium]
MKKKYSLLVLFIFIFVGSLSFVSAAQEDTSSNETRKVDTRDTQTKTVDAHECERYPERCPDVRPIKVETKTDDFRDTDDDGDIVPTRYERSASELGDTENNKVEGAKTYNSTRSNRTGGIFIGDNEIEDCKWDPPKCRDELEVRIMESQIKVRTDDTLWCWGRAGRECPTELREERRDILKDRLQVEQRQYQRLRLQFKPRVERLFERLSEEEYDRLSERLASLIEQHQDSSNTRLLAAILVLQELLESVERL